MADLTGQSISSTYNTLLTTAGADISGSLQVIQDGRSNSSALKLSTTDVSVDGSLCIGTETASGIAARTVTLNDASNAGYAINYGDAAAAIFYADGTKTALNSYTENVSLEFGTTPTGGSLTPRMYVNPDGDVGIGATPNTYSNYTTLTIAGAAAGGSIVDLECNAVRIASFYTNGSTDARIITHTTAPLLLGANSVPFMRIDSSGNVMVGKTSSGSSLVGFETSQTGNCAITRDGASPLIVNRLTDDGELVLFRQANLTRGSVSISGSTTSYNETSDYRLKENVVTDWDATTRLKQLKPSRFNFIADADQTVDGFLAHEVSSIVPNAITGEKDATYTSEDEENDLGVEGEAKHQLIDHGKLIPLMVKTIQELEARIKTLEGSA